MAKQDLGFDDLNFLEEDLENEEYNANRHYSSFKKLCKLPKLKLIIIVIVLVITPLLYYKNKLLFSNINPKSTTFYIVKDDQVSININDNNLSKSNLETHSSIETVTIKSQNINNHLTTVANRPQQNTNFYYNIKTINELIIPIDSIIHATMFITDTTKVLQQKIQETSRTIHNIKNKTNNINLKIIKLTNNVNDLVVSFKQRLERDLELATYDQQATQQAFSKSSKYLVYAIIPGRAWLKSDQGIIISVMEGEQLDDYGKITEIDPDNYSVKTNSGVIIR